MESHHIAWLDTLRLADRPSVGGKCASLGELMSADIPVPLGFAVTVEAFEEAIDHASLRSQLQDLTRDVDPTNSGQLRAVQDRAVKLLETAELKPSIEQAIREGYLELCRRVGRDDVPVAVRSSAVAEDGASASFAGQQETYLWVIGSDDILARVRDCWASLFTPQAIAYRTKLDDAHRAEAVRMSVAIQEMVDAEVAGVAFTVSPITGDPSVMAINASWGLGEAVVSGEVTPDEYWLSKIGPSVTRTTVSHKAHQCVPAAGRKGTEMVEVSAEKSDIACLDEDLIKELAGIALRVEKHYGGPQDIEWALARDSDGGHRFMLLQSRPETVNAAAREARKAAPAAGSSYLSVLQKLGSKTRNAS